MNKIEVSVLHEGHSNPEGLMMFLAQLTQRGHTVKDMESLVDMYNKSIAKYHWKTSSEIANLPHGTIKRCAPIMIAIVGASRRFLSQIRTHGVGLTFVSASLQYSDYSDEGQFCIPYEILESDLTFSTDRGHNSFINSCEDSMITYKNLVDTGFSNDTAGYVAPQALRNILIISGNHEAWDSLINKRTCRRNTPETAYVTALIWKELYETTSGDVFFDLSGPDCLGRGCREGKMCCLEPYTTVSSPVDFIEQTWPLMEGFKHA